MTENKVDVIIVGAGPAGSAAAITLARANKKVVLLERGDFAGSKNMFGGAIYEYPTNELYPTFKEEAPIERINKEHRYIINDDKSSVSVSYKSEKPSTSYTVLRAKWDKWCADRAVELGAYFSPQTTVREVLKKDGKVVGIRTDEEDFFADVVILADGVNSLLAKQLGMRRDIKDSEAAIGVKEVLKLPKEVIEQRFNLGENEGCVTEIIGSPMKSMMGLGFIYTNKESISVGIGVNLDELTKNKITPNELLNLFKETPAIAPLVKDGELLEYSAHLIPEGGFKAIPKLYDDGVMIVGDAAMLVNNVHFEGTNIAMLSGKLAAETAIEAIDANDFSKSMLSRYEQKLKNTSFYKDLKTYKDTVKTAHNNSESFFGYYPEKINEFFEIITQTGYIPKKSLFRRYIKNFIKERKYSSLFKDIVSFIKISIGIIK
ncbi:MAG: FAD-dependent oxidoreductase [Candidatus Gastranaerophilales bacterium]|nr:FAD-dependent oxidoreductase [Candidatus Gastranaerophilales bacterium]